MLGDKQLVYVMHENSVLRIVGYVMRYFAGGAKPIPPWSLWRNFNKRHRSFGLRPEHFTPDGEIVTKLLIQEIEAIDPGWKVTGGEPVFIETAAKKRLPLTRKIDYSSSEAPMRSALTNEKTFFSVMNQVFGRTRA